MSQTSKVSQQIRQAIISFLSPGTTATNHGLQSHVAPTVSLRAVQEATQKLTREGVLVQTKSNGKTWYGVATPASPLVRIQFLNEYRRSGEWQQSQNDGTTGLYSPAEAEEIIARQPDRNQLKYRTVPEVQ